MRALLNFKIIRKLEGGIFNSPSRKTFYTNLFIEFIYPHKECLS